MVNPAISGLEISPDFDPHYRDIAIEDFELLGNVIANRPGTVGNLFVLSLRISNFLRGEPIRARDQCLVC